MWFVYNQYIKYLVVMVNGYEYYYGFASIIYGLLSVSMIIIFMESGMIRNMIFDF